jgi:glycogen debranching enzyme
MTSALDLTEAVYSEAIEALIACCCPRGLQASGDTQGYHQVWARDAGIASLGARIAPDDPIQTALRTTFTSLGQCQSASGEIPNNLDSKSGRPNFRAYGDSGLWWILASASISPDLDRIRAALRWYECQDVDQSGLISIQEGSDWQDLFCTRGKGLYVNCLYVLALRAAARIFETSDPAASEAYLRRAAHAVERINAWFWYRGDGDMLRHVSHTFSTEGQPGVDTLGRKRWIPEKRHLAGEQYYLPYLGFRAVGEWFDSLANLLAVLSGVADERQSSVILDFIARHSLDVWPLASLTPVLRPGDTDWRDYYGSLNTPHQYHNGGVWPFIGGFYVAALVKAGRAAAAAALRKLAELNRSGEFNEWHHGETGKPMGVRHQAWSAGMYLYAFEAVRTNRVVI